MDMKRIYNNVCLLLMLLLVTACNDKGDVTVVIEDGQPAIRTLIVGKWKPEHKGWMDKQTGEIKGLSDIDSDSEDGLLWEFFEDGTFGFSDGDSSIGGKFDWNANDDEYAVEIDGEKWTIAQLTEYMMGIYREGHPGDEGYDPNSWLYYGFGRYDAFEGNDEEEPAPDENTSYRIASISVETEFRASATVYSFRYNEDGTIRDWAINGDDVAAYIYNGDKVMVSADGRYQATLNSDGYVEIVQQSFATAPDWKTVASIAYDNDGFMSIFNNYGLDYTNGNRNASGDFAYKYTDVANRTMPDLNCFISNYSNYYEYSYGHYSLFAPFGMMGKPSENMIMEERHPLYDYYYTYDYKQDEKGRIVQIMRSSINQVGGNNDVLNQTTFNITYTD